MKAIAVVPESRDVRLIELDEPQLRSPHDVKVRILEVGVCGTDREICRFDLPRPMAPWQLAPNSARWTSAAARP